MFSLLLFHVLRMCVFIYCIWHILLFQSLSSLFLPSSYLQIMMSLYMATHIFFLCLFSVLLNTKRNKTILWFLHNHETHWRGRHLLSKWQYASNMENDAIAGGKEVIIYKCKHRFCYCRCNWHVGLCDVSVYIGPSYIV